MTSLFHVFVVQGTPQVTETFIDSKKEVDAYLKRTCEQFIAIVCQHLLATLKDYLQNVRHSGTHFLFRDRRVSMLIAV